MDNLSGEMTTARRMAALDSGNSGEYVSTIRAISSNGGSEVVSPRANVWVYNCINRAADIEIANCFLRNEKFKPEKYFHSDPIVYRQTCPELALSSCSSFEIGGIVFTRQRDYVGRDFLTNQPIFRERKLNL